MSFWYRFIGGALLVAVVLLATSTIRGQSGEASVQANLQAYIAARTAPYRNLTTFSFRVYSDIHMIENPAFGLTRTDWQSLLTRWRDTSQLFAVIVGDLGYGNAADPGNVLSGPATVPGAPPVFYAMGNHETDGIGKRAWLDALYPGAVQPASWTNQAGVAPGNADHVYYSFDVGPLTHFIVLDGDYMIFDGITGYARQSFGQAQLTWLAADIRANSTKNILVFVHEPLDQQVIGTTPYYTLNDKGGLIDLLAAHPKQSFIFSGHLHAMSGITHWKGITSVHAMTGVRPDLGVGVSINGDQILLTGAGTTTEFDQYPMNQIEVAGSQRIVHVAEDGVNSGNTRGPKMVPVVAENGVIPTSGAQMLKALSLTWFDPRFISEQLIKVQPGMKFSFDVYLLGVVGGNDAVTVQPDWYMKNGSLPPLVVDQNGIQLSRRSKDGIYFTYNEDVPKLGGRATGQWYHREFDLSALAGNYVDGVYLTSSATNVNVGTIYVDNIRFTWPAVVNVSPSVRLTSPTEGASFSAPATIPLTAVASDPDGTVASVRYFSGATLIGSVTSPPFSGSWSPVPAGSYTLTATATDNVGATTTSLPVHVTVASVTVPPVPPPVPPPVQTATLTVTATGRSGGVVTSSPAGIDITVGGTGSASFAIGTTVTLTIPGGRALWSGACSTTRNKKTCTFTVTGTATVTAVVQ